jgi:type III pantothenate kinase
MLLAVDVGNTITKLALCPPSGEAVEHTWRVGTDRARTPDEWHALLASLFAVTGTRLEAVGAVVVASVVPSVTRSVATACRDRLGVEPLLLASTDDLGIEVRTELVAETGIDRVLNALAAERTLGGPAIVVDCGTATKFDAVSTDGAFVGGAIGPGLALTLEALAGRAARLYAVELVAPPTSIGRNTIQSIQSGVVLGYLAMCEGMIRKISAELGGARVVATGGAGAILAEHSTLVERYDAMLTMSGILAAYRRLTGNG